MSDPKKSAKPPKASDPKIEAIKDIIFGDTIQEIEREFSDVQTLLTQYKADTEQQVNQLRSTMDKMVDELRQDMDKQVTALKEEMSHKFGELRHSSADRSLLGKMLEDIGKKLQS